MLKLTETFACKAPHPATGTRKYWDSEIKGLGLFIGKKAKTWYFQRDVGGQTRRALIGRYPVISAVAARQAAQSLALDMSRGVGKIPPNPDHMVRASATPTGVNAARAA